MSVSAISPSPSLLPSSHQVAQVSGHHRHGGQTPSLTDVDAQGSSVASTPSSTGKIENKINITV